MRGLRGNMGTGAVEYSRWGARVRVRWWISRAARRWRVRSAEAGWSPEFYFSREQNGRKPVRYLGFGPLLGRSTAMARMVSSALELYASLWTKPVHGVFRVYQIPLFWLSDRESSREYFCSCAIQV